MGKTRAKKNSAARKNQPRPRLLSVELLRVFAILGIATFHTFQPWFSDLVDGYLAESYLGLGFISHPAFLAAMGLVDQLGAWGNHVFIMISGCFLLPRAAEEASEGARGWKRAQEEAGRRSASIILSTALYIVAALLVSRFLPDATSLSEDNLAWLAQGLQFIWIYLILVLICPTLGWLWSRCQRKTAVLAAFTLIVYGVNLYIAFASPGAYDRSLFEWRKLMSGVTYALSFVIGGWLGDLFADEEAADEKRVLARRALILSVGATVAAELIAGISGDLRILEALSFKSTSLFACTMAASALAYALSAATGQEGEHPVATRLAAYVASGALGFYALQAIFSTGWHEYSNALLAWAIGGGAPAFLVAGLAFSCALPALLIGIDVLFRQRLFESLGH